MPIYDYKCSLCQDLRQVRRPIKDSSEVICCGNPMERTFTKAPSAVVTPQHRAVKDKFKYYGVKNVQTGEGITKDTDVSTPPGISTGDL